jgi:hypothetical protein
MWCSLAELVLYFRRWKQYWVILRRKGPATNVMHPNFKGFVRLCVSSLGNGFETSRWRLEKRLGYEKCCSSVGFGVETRLIRRLHEYRRLLYKFDGEKYARTRKRDIETKGYSDDERELKEQESKCRRWWKGEVLESERSDREERIEVEGSEIGTRG